MHRPSMTMGNDAPIECPARSSSGIHTAQGSLTQTRSQSRIEASLMKARWVALEQMMPDCSVGCDLVAEFDRGVNPRQWFEASARSMHDNSSIVEYATPKGLVHVHALD